MRPTFAFEAASIRRRTANVTTRPNRFLMTLPVIPCSMYDADPAAVGTSRTAYPFCDSKFTESFVRVAFVAVHDVRMGGATNDEKSASSNGLFGSTCAPRNGDGSVA